MNYKIGSKEFEVLDVLANITIVNTSVSPNHKIQFEGKDKPSHGERKIYLPGNIEEKSKFFDNFSRDVKGFLTRENLLEYLKNAKREYYSPTQDYYGRKNMKTEFDMLEKRLMSSAEYFAFSVMKSKVTHKGFYINQNSGRKSDENWNLITDIALPGISRLSIIKVRADEGIRYYFKIGYGISDEPEKEEKEQLIEEEYIKNIENDIDIAVTEKEAIIKARVGQGIYRKKLFESIDTICPFTFVDDEHLLIASHIKPWKDSSNKEKYDPQNGFIFTPTYDKLFDRGYISFNNDKSLIVSPWLSRYNRGLLNLKEGQIIDKLPDIINRRKVFLEYHRKNVLKKLEEL